MAKASRRKRAGRDTNARLKLVSLASQHPELPGGFADGTVRLGDLRRLLGKLPPSPLCDALSPHFGDTPRHCRRAA
jgi:hypothetical protein